MTNFEQFTAHVRDAMTIEPREGFFTLNGVTYFDNSLKSRKRIRAFPDDLPCWRSAVVLSERGNVLCIAAETDRMGLRVLNPEYMGFPGSPYTAMYEGAKWDREESEEL